MPSPADMHAIAAASGMANRASGGEPLPPSEDSELLSNSRRGAERRRGRRTQPSTPRGSIARSGLHWTHEQAFTRAAIDLGYDVTGEEHGKLASKICVGLLGERVSLKTAALTAAQWADPFEKLSDYARSDLGAIYPDACAAATIAVHNMHIMLKLARPLPGPPSAKVGDENSSDVVLVSQASSEVKSSSRDAAVAPTTSRVGDGRRKRKREASLAKRDTITISDSEEEGSSISKEGTVFGMLTVAFCEGELNKAIRGKPAKDFSAAGLKKWSYPDFKRQRVCTDGDPSDFVMKIAGSYVTALLGGYRRERELFPNPDDFDAAVVEILFRRNEVDCDFLRLPMLRKDAEQAHKVSTTLRSHPTIAALYATTQVDESTRLGDQD